MAVALRVGPTAEERSDECLVADVRRGDDSAFECLYERYRRRIATFVYGMVGDWGRAEDVTQEVFISALRRMRETERPIAFKPWVYEIAKNACIDQFRRARRAEEVSFDAEDGLRAADHGRLADPTVGPEGALERKQELDELVGAFGGLSDSHHEILVLRELEGLSYRQIGERMGLTRPSVESTLFRARRRLTEEYDDLKTGRRCQRVQASIDDACEHPLGVREQGRVTRHVAHCLSCRRHAVRRGASDLLFDHPRRRSLGARVAALLPIPAFFRRSRGSGGSTSHAAVGVASQVAPVLASGTVGWGRAAVATLTVVAAGSAGFITEKPSHQAAPPAGARAAVADRSAEGLAGRLLRPFDGVAPTAVVRPGSVVGVVLTPALARDAQRARGGHARRAGGRGSVLGGYVLDPLVGTAASAAVRAAGGTVVLTTGATARTISLLTGGSVGVVSPTTLRALTRQGYVTAPAGRRVRGILGAILRHKPRGERRTSSRRYRKSWTAAGSQSSSSSGSGSGSASQTGSSQSGSAAPAPAGGSSQSSSSPSPSGTPSG
jgi:RNA polymerase sigma factor (sigma-70 family)